MFVLLLLMFYYDIIVTGLLHFIYFASTVM